MKPNRNYYLLLAGQFLGAFGDNFLLAAILGPLTFQLTAGLITEQYVNHQNSLFGLALGMQKVIRDAEAGPRTGGDGS